MHLSALQKAFRALKNPARATISKRFFKSGKGQYGEGDQFLGITVPTTRQFAKHCTMLTLDDIETLLASPWHEERLLATILLVTRYKKGDAALQQNIYHLYLKNIGKGINNWDIVDTSAPHIVGAYLENRGHNDLCVLAASNNLWKKRVAIVATQHFIRNNDFIETLKLCKILLNEKQDLLHKACGWMLREIGKRDIQTLRTFLKEHTQYMPRTMLRYAIEHLSPKERESWLVNAPTRPRVTA